jgi:ribosomal protein L37E
MKLLKWLFGSRKPALNKPVVSKRYSVAECGSCKYFEQGKTCSFCGHPDQPNEDFKRYLYYNFACSLHEQGIAQSRVDYMKTCAKA